MSLSACEYLWYLPCRGASDSQCLTLLAGSEYSTIVGKHNVSVECLFVLFLTEPFPRVDLGSQFPKDDLLFTPSSETAQISFSMKVGLVRACFIVSQCHSISRSVILLHPDTLKFSTLVMILWWR